MIIGMQIPIISMVSRTSGQYYRLYSLYYKDITQKLNHPGNILEHFTALQQNMDRYCYTVQCSFFPRLSLFYSAIVATFTVLLQIVYYLLHFRCKLSTYSIYWSTSQFSGRVLNNSFRQIFTFNMTKYKCVYIHI